MPLYSSYVPQTEHLEHQAKMFAEHVDDKCYALFWEQGCCKTKVYIDWVAYLYENGLIDALVLVAPPGVERNFLVKELAKHWPTRLPYKAFVYNSKQAKNVSAERDRKAILEYREGLAIVCISYAAFVTDKGKLFIKNFFRRRKCAHILDESHFIKNPGSTRTKTLVASGEYCEYKRIGTGTPMGPETCMDLYSQIKFLFPTFWKDKGIPDFACYKAFFGDWVQMDGWAKLLRLKNQDKLKEWLAPISSRVTKAEVLPWLPPKLHTRCYIELPPEHRRAYNQMRDDLRAELLSGAEVSIKTQIVKLRKLLQLASGYLQNTETEEIYPIDNQFPRVDACEDWADGGREQGIIWARFKHDAKLIQERLGSSRIARYDGSISDPEERARELESFERGDKEFLLSSYKVGGTGLTLVNATRQWHHGVDTDSVAFKQAQDRSHRPGLKTAVNYTYCVAADTVDEKVIDAHLRNEETIRDILGDNFSELL
jgi:SNF2 family DNA or RNA helicase